MKHVHCSFQVMFVEKLSAICTGVAASLVAMDASMPSMVCYHHYTEVNLPVRSYDSGRKFDQNALL